MAAGALTPPRLFLGRALKSLRAESGKTLDECAAAIGKSRARVINVLDGVATLTARELSQLLDFLGASRARKSELLELGVEARKRPGRNTLSDPVPSSYRRLASMEQLASEVCCYERGIIPGLLQAPEYINALMVDADGIWWDSSPQALEERVSFRTARQKVVLAADPPKAMHFVITDDALNTMVGGRMTMKRQLAHLLSLMEQPNITVQVLAATTPNNPAPAAGLTLLRIGGRQHSVAFLPVLYGPSVYLDDAVIVDRLSRAFDKLIELAMTPTKSRHLVADLEKSI